MPFREIASNVFVWTDTCNVYVIKDGDAALLIDLGDGSVLEHLSEIGVKSVEWVLFTHHHREQCQGAPHLAKRNAKIAAPELERPLFESPASFRKVKVTLNDQYTVYGASYVRPPIEPIKLDRGFKTMDDFQWRGREFVCIDTRGNSPGSMSYLLHVDGKRIAFSGDVMCNGAKLHNWFDSEWDYGFAAGIYPLFSAAALLERYEPSLLCPSHGPVIREAVPQLREYQQKLRKLVPLFLRGYDVNTFAAADQDNVSRPTSVPHVWQITKHLFKFKGPSFWPNFTILIADSGHALVIDCGLFDPAFLDKAINGMRERLGLKQIDAILVTHAHGDHFLEAEHMRQKWGCQLWTMAGVNERCETPQRFDYVAPIQSYGSSIQRGIECVKFDKLFPNGSFFEWEGYQLSVDWMPGQTKYACCLHGEIDGKRVVFTGDNIFGSTSDPKQNGHEAIVARNSCILEEGYLYAAHFLHGIGPDLLIGGHSWVMPEPQEFIERYRETAEALRDAFRSLSLNDDYRYMFDPFWVRADPYRVFVKPGETAEFHVLIRNFRDRPQKHRIELHAPAGLKVEPAVLEGVVPGDLTLPFPVKLTAEKNLSDGIRIVAFEMTIDGQRYGELFDFMAVVGNVNDGPAANAPAKKSGY